MNYETIKVGDKFFNFKADQDEPTVIRIRSIDPNKDKVKYYNTKTMDRGTMSLSKLCDSYTKLAADGTIIFSIVSLDETPSKDVIVSMGTVLDNGLQVVCRQCVYDVFSQCSNPLGKNIGISISRDTCPANIPFESFLGCKKIEYSKVVNIYMDDTLLDILNLIRTTKFDTVLRNIKSNFERRGEIVAGACETLYGLLSANQFMYDFRRCFGIEEIPFSIDYRDESLDSKNTKYFEENIVNCRVERTYVVKFSHMIDFDSIKREYRLVTCAQDNHSQVFVVGFDRAE